MSDIELVKNTIRDVVDFPKEGIVFKDITTVLSNEKAFKIVIDMLASHLKEQNISKIVAIESRGFIFGAPLSYLLDIGLVLVRKPGKLPYKTENITYQLEYGEDSLEIHVDAIKKGENVVIIDDLLATGGTALATAQLVEKLGGNVKELLFVIELGFLKARDKIKYPTFSLIKY